MTTVLFLVFVSFAAYCRFWLWRVAKHDRVLFPFCQLRRDIMCFLREHFPSEPNALSREEYDSILRLLDVVSAMIHHYNRHKTVMFNLRKVIKCIREYRHALKQIPAIDMTNNAEIQKFHHRFEGLLARAFIAYTPLIRSERALRMFVFACRVGKLRAQYVIKGAATVRECERRYGLVGSAPAV